jgi:hypothetical protein
MGNLRKEMQETAAAMDKAMGPEFGARFRKNMAKNMAQGLANSMAEQFLKKEMAESKDLGSLKKELAEKMKKLALETEGAPVPLGREGDTSEKGSKAKEKGSKVKAKGFVNLKRDEL